ncbi:MAG: minor capsid protein [Lachnospiraceae bacterium]
MAQKHNFEITTPRGSISTITNAAGVTTVQLKWNADFVPRKKVAFSQAQSFVDSECIRYMNPLTPRRTGTMVKSATLGTVIGSGTIEYLTPYARRQYHKHKTKAKWFERMKATHKEPILKGALKIASQ